MQDITRVQLHMILVNRLGVQASESNVKSRLDEVLNGWRLDVPYLRDLEQDITAWHQSRVTTMYGEYMFPTRQQARRARDELARLGFVSYLRKPINGAHSHP